VERHPGVSLHPGLHLRGGVGGGVVQDQVEISGRERPVDPAEEAEELLVAVPEPALAHHPARGHLEGRIQAGGAVPAVVVGPALGLTWLEGQRGLGPVNRLDLGLLVHAQDQGVCRRIEVQAHDVDDLGLELGVGGVLERPGLVGLQAVGPPDPVHGGGGKLHRFGQLPDRPVRQALGRRLQGPGDHPIHLGVVDGPGPAGPRTSLARTPRWEGKAPTLRRSRCSKHRRRPAAPPGLAGPTGCAPSAFGRGAGVRFVRRRTTQSRRRSVPRPHRTTTVLHIQSTIGTEH
jgi:hypothetical protein